MNLAEPIYRLRGLRKLRDPDLFAQVQIAEYGRALEWPGDIDIGANRLRDYTLSAIGRDDAVTFRRWQIRHGLSLNAAAEALGLSRRMMAYYCRLRALRLHFGIQTNVRSRSVPSFVDGHLPPRKRHALGRSTQLGSTLASIQPPIPATKLAEQ